MAWPGDAPPHYVEKRVREFRVHFQRQKQIRSPRSSLLSHGPAGQRASGSHSPAAPFPVDSGVWGDCSIRLSHTVWFSLQAQTTPCRGPQLPTSWAILWGGHRVTSQHACDAQKWGSTHNTDVQVWVQPRLPASGLSAHCMRFRQVISKDFWVIRTLHCVGSWKDNNSWTQKTSKLWLTTARHSRFSFTPWPELWGSHISCVWEEEASLQ